MVARAPKLLPWRIALAILLATGLAGCGRSAPPRTWVATSRVPVYQAPDDADVLAFDVAPGERCTLGEERIAKVYRYVEVRCPGKGHGWASAIP